MKLLKYLLASLFCSSTALAQYAPQHPLPGNTAIHKSDTSIKAWATNAVITRGYIDIMNPSLGMVSSGTVTNAIGAADNMVVSLGDGGTIILSFAQPIMNGPQADFVVFENAFADPLDPSLAFLELAFVEVSTDGIRYVRFPAASATQTDTQIENDQYYDATQIHNLAGKYISNYGTPFDLEELKDSVGIDINNIKYVKIIDVVGILDEALGSKDRYGNIINDPYPTAFPTGGFDLDAVGVIHANTSLGLDNSIAAPRFDIYPNPIKDYLHIKISQNPKALFGYVYNINGQEIHRFPINNSLIIINTEQWKSGTYLIKIENQTNILIKQ